MKIASRTGRNLQEFGTLLFDVENDPHQNSPLDDPEVEAEMIELLIRHMKANNSPPEQCERLGLSEQLRKSN